MTIVTFVEIKFNRVLNIKALLEEFFLAKILGIDPGSIKTGWGVVDTQNSLDSASGVIYLEGESTFAARLARLQTELQKVIETYKPSSVAIERVFLGKSADSAFKLGHARGVAMAAAGQQHLKVYEYATRHVKKVLTGSGAATKEQVQFVVESLLNKKVRELDASDALAVALCHGRELEVEIMINKQMNKQIKKHEVQL